MSLYGTFRDLMSRTLNHQVEGLSRRKKLLVRRPAWRELISDMLTLQGSFLLLRFQPYHKKKSIAFVAALIRPEEGEILKREKSESSFPDEI